MGRLIDVDALIKSFETIQQDEDAIGLDFVAIVDEIKEQPTAYDPDKVVEQLEYYLFEKYCVEGDTEIDRIVKAGGTNDNSN